MNRYFEMLSMLDPGTVDLQRARGGGRTFERSDILAALSGLERRHEVYLDLFRNPDKEHLYPLLADLLVVAMRDQYGNDDPQLKVLDNAKRLHCYAACRAAVRIDFGGALCETCNGTGMNSGRVCEKCGGSGHGLGERRLSKLGGIGYTSWVKSVGTLFLLMRAIIFQVQTDVCSHLAQQLK